MKRLIVCLALLVTLGLTGCGGSSNVDRSDAIAQEIHADECVATDYQIIRRTDNSKARIYDCLVNGVEKCVTEENGIASDQTAIVRLLFANALSGGKPVCAS
jgi:hypothetical protein